MKNNVEIYTWSTCPYSKKAKALLQKKGIKYTEYCIDGDDLARAAMSVRANGKKTLPQIFINNQHIGGCDDLHNLDEICSLDEMLEEKSTSKLDDQQLPKVEIYTWSTCPYSARAKALLRERKVAFTEYCIDGDDLAQAAMTKRAEGRHTLPQIFINDRSIGGCDDLHILDKICSLDEMLAEESAPEMDDQRLAKIEIYTWSTCPYSARAKTLLRKRNIPYTEYCIDGDDLARAAMTKRAEGRHTLPQIFINDRSVGGCDDLHILDAIGSLDELLSSIYQAAKVSKQTSNLWI